MVPGPRKAKIVRQMLAEHISTACPATILMLLSISTMSLPGPEVHVCYLTLDEQLAP